MSDDIVSLNKYKVKREEEAKAIPEFVVEKLKLIHDKAAEGKLRSVIVHFLYDSDESEDEEEGGTMLWHSQNNWLELLGMTEVIKTAAYEGGEVYEEE